MLKSLKASIQYLKGVGPKRLNLFENVGVKTAEDLLYYFPKRYEDRSNMAVISKLKADEPQTILVTVLKSSLRRSPRRKIFIFELIAWDKTGKIKCLWFNQPYLKKYFAAGQKLVLFGKPEIYQGRLQLNSPEYEVLDEKEEVNSLGASLNVGRIVPVYGLTEGLNQRYLRKIVKSCLDEYIMAVSDILPFDIRNRHKFLNLAQSLKQIHFPADFKSQEEAFRRLCFEEFFLYQLPVILRKLSASQKQGIVHKIDKLFLKEMINGLPFKLTQAQERVLNEILLDMSSVKPMHRLLQGDVGSGKTIVAFLAGLVALSNGYQVAFMVPTEILASQHFKNFSAFLKKDQRLKDLRIAMLTSGIDKKSQANICRKIKNGKVNLIIGTHSLIEEDLEFNNLGLVVIDEQHKFGVSQRQLLPKKGRNMDVLIMTATPIPRTLSLTIYADLDVSVIDQLPKDRLAVKTMQFAPNQRRLAYEFVKIEIRQGRQAYIIYPLIEESDLLELKAAKQMFELLQKNEFKEYKLELIHGRMKRAQAESAMRSFIDGKTDVLVATTILEVGVDVANASCMVIENAEAFGLSQIHQLRGRIGRGKYQSFCLLITEPKTEEAKARIAAITNLNDGFKIAEEDLRIRGPGEFFGKRQHGLSELKIANPITQMHLLKLAREEAVKLLKQDPNLSLRQNAAIKKFIQQRFSHQEMLTIVG
jgi:ATP-dependent DNA helicase RecG